MREELADETRERLAAYAHEAWSGWMRYMLSKCEPQADGTVIMPAWAVERWTRQAATVYADLPEQEKASDRAEADKILVITDAEEQKVVVVEAWESVPFRIGNISIVNPPQGEGS